MNRARWQSLAGGLELACGVAAVVAVGVLVSWSHTDPEPRLSQAQQRVIDHHNATCRVCRVPRIAPRIPGLEDIAAPGAEVLASRPLSRATVAVPNVMTERVAMASAFGIPERHPSGALGADSSSMGAHRRNPAVSRPLP